MNSHYIRMFEAKDLDQAVVDITYTEFKDAIEGTNQKIKEFHLIAKETKLSSDLVSGFDKNMADYIKDYREQYPQYAVRYDQEKQKPINDAKLAQCCDVLEISASVICFAPSYVLTLGHCFGCFCYGKSLYPRGECGDLCMPLNWKNRSDYRTSKEVIPQLNFFCKPIGNIIDKVADFKRQNEIINQLRSEAPVQQRMG